MWLSIVAEFINFSPIANSPVGILFKILSIGLFVKNLEDFLFSAYLLKFGEDESDSLSIILYSYNNIPTQKYNINLYIFKNSLKANNNYSNF